MRTLGGLDYIVDLGIYHWVATLKLLTKCLHMSLITWSLEFLVLTSVVDIKDNSEELKKNEKGTESIKRCLKLVENVSSNASEAISLHILLCWDYIVFLGDTSKPGESNLFGLL